MMKRNIVKKLASIMDVNETVVNQAGTDQPANTSPATEGVTTQEEKVDKNVYEKVREAMKSEREAKKAAEAKNAELEERLARLEATRPTVDDGGYDSYKAKTDILVLMNKDSFVKENLDLIEQKMTDNPDLDVASAVREVKSDFFDRIQKEVATVDSNQPLKQEKPTAVQEPRTVELSGSPLKDALDGKYENMHPAQLEAIKRVLNK